MAARLVSGRLEHCLRFHQAVTRIPRYESRAGALFYTYTCVWGGRGPYWRARRVVSSTLRFTIVQLGEGSHCHFQSPYISLNFLAAPPRPDGYYQQKYKMRMDLSTNASYGKSSAHTIRIYLRVEVLYKCSRIAYTCSLFLRTVWISQAPRSQVRHPQPAYREKALFQTRHKNTRPLRAPVRGHRSLWSLSSAAGVKSGSTSDLRPQKRACTHIDTPPAQICTLCLFTFNRTHTHTPKNMNMHTHTKHTVTISSEQHATL